METVGTRELKQNPSAVIDRVLASGQEVEVTAYGHPTGVSLVPDRPARSRWVAGDRLGDITPFDATGLVEEIEELRDGGLVTDPWADRP